MTRFNRHGEDSDSEFKQLSFETGLGDSESAWPEPCHEAALAQHSFSHSLRHLPASEEPRDRMLEYGAAALSASELLDILLGSRQGSSRSSALSLGQQLLQVLSADGLEPLRYLREMTIEEVTAIPGIGPAKAATVLAAIELGKRVFLAKPEKRAVVDDPNVAVEALSQDLMWQTSERFAVVLLDIEHRLLGTHVVTIGTATETLAHPRDVFRLAIRRDATRIIIAHNHPSGDVAPSPEDLQLTRQFLKAALVLGVPVLDHLILGSGQYRSLRASTRLWEEHPQE